MIGAPSGWEHTAAVCMSHSWYEGAGDVMIAHTRAVIEFQSRPGFIRLMTDGYGGNWFGEGESWNYEEVDP